MNHTAELEKALTDLRHITGISMEIHAETESAGAVKAPFLRIQRKV